MNLNKRLLYVTFAAVSVLLAAVIVPAQAAALTLDQCIALGERYDAGLKARTERVGQAAARVREARGGMLPSIDFSADQEYRQAVSPAANEGWVSRFSVTQPLFSGFARSSAFGAARQLSARETYLLKSASRDLKSGIARAFYTVALVQSGIKNTVETLDLLEQRLKEVRGRVQLGKSNYSDQLSVESQIAALRAERERLEGDRRSALEDLALLTGAEASAISIEDNLPAQNAAPSLDLYLSMMAGRSDLAAVRADAAAQEYQVKAARGSFLPTVGVSGSWNPSHSGTYASTPDWQAFLSLNLSLFQGGSLKARLEEEERLLEELRLNETQLSREIAAEIKKQWNALASSISQTRALREASDKAEKSYAVQAKDYRLGLVNNLDVLQSMSVMVGARQNFDRAEIQAKLNRVLLDIAVEHK